MLFSSTCLGCGATGKRLCNPCRFSLASIRPFRGSHGISAAFPFDGVARELVVGLKFRQRRDAAAIVATHMVRRLPLTDVDVVTWAPTSARRVRHRGYDQAEAIARAVARQLGVPCRRLLYRSHGTTQTGKTRSQRLTGPRFRARRPKRGLAVLVVDDVVTTGATLRSAAQALRQAGVERVELAAAVGVVAQPAAVRHLDRGPLTLVEPRSPP